MISNALLRFKGRLKPHFLLILAVATVALIIIGCGGNTPTMQSSSMGAISVSVSDPPSCAAASSTRGKTGGAVGEKSHTTEWP